MMRGEPIHLLGPIDRRFSRGIERGLENFYSMSESFYRKVFGKGG